MSVRFFLQTIFYISLLVFVGFKLPFLGLPYFWDDAWSYIPAISDMVQKGPCLLPGCINPDLYKGHPLFYYFLNSVWATIFGFTPFCLQLFALGVSVFTVFRFKAITTILFNEKSGFLLSFLLLLQVVFFVQSSFVLPEVFLALCLVQSLLFYQKDKIILYVIWATLLGFTKETGLVLLPVFVVHDIVKNIQKKQQLNWSRTTKLLIPILINVLFYLYQYAKLGWFFYPQHTSFISFNLNEILSKLKIIFYFLFLDQGRFVLAVSIMFLILLLKKTKLKIKIGLGFLIILLVVSYFYNFRWTGALLSFGVILFLNWKEILDFSNIKSLVFLLIMTIISFSSLNFLMVRYLLLSIPLLLILMYKSQYLEILNARVLIVVFFLIIFGFSKGWYKSISRGWHDDVSLNYPNSIRVSQNVVDFCESNNLYNKTIGTHFLMSWYLTNYDCGYLKEIEKKFTSVKDILKQDHSQDYDILIISNIEYNDKMEKVVSPNYQLIHSIEIGKAWSKVYSKK